MSKNLSHAFTFLIGSIATWIFISLFGINNVNSSWELTYSNDKQGQPLYGSKQKLIDAVREGKSVRIYWSGTVVEHLTDTFFITILGGEVFAQIESIQGQTPSLDPPKIELRENQWRAIFSTNGNRELKWFVQQ